MIFSSSAAVFGSPQYLPIDENHPKNPESYYGFTKLEIERFMAWYDQLKGLKFAALRYFLGVLQLHSLPCFIKCSLSSSVFLKENPKVFCAFIKLFSLVTIFSNNLTTH